MIPEIKAFHLEATNICTLKCSGCARTRFLEKWPQHWKNHSLDTEQLLAFLDVDISGISFNLCGNYGDPIYHPKLPYLVQEIKNRGGLISITTNGSHKSVQWWQDLCALLTQDDVIIFSIDGLPENFTIYRVNADWVSIEQAIAICVKSKAQTCWKYIPFRYNQDDIETARKLSQDLGFDKFHISPSDRFNEETQHLMPDKRKLGNRFQSQQEFKQNITQRVDPKCNKGYEHFISAAGHYVPCCFLADHRFYYKNIFGKNLDLFDIRTTTLTQILDRPQVIEFYANIEHDPISACQYNCPKVS
jgi:MoaA/NifB/PqqE/SkfB family radical SAM enzyme